MTQLAMHIIQLPEVDATVDALGMRFCTTRAMADLLASAAPGNQTSSTASTAHAEMLRSRQAMSLSLKGNPQRAVESLLEHGPRPSTPRSSNRPTSCCNGTKTAFPSKRP